VDEKLKHLEFIQAVISRMATNSFLFKGWAITIAAGLGAFAAADTEAAVVLIALVSTLMFWGLDGYYLWLERGFIKLYEAVADKAPDDVIDFKMAPDKSDAIKGWLKVCFCRPHLYAFYGSIIIIELAGALWIRSK
jgi:hypothetical protein